MSSKLPADYLERVYAGVLGKLIGVYIGRPFEGWTHQRIMQELGPIRYYVHEKFNLPLVVTDDDVSGTFVFLRALEEHGITADLSAEEIGKTWLNQIVEKKSILWWGGRGISTEHTAYLNLKKGIKAPASGSIGTNGKTVAEQIGAQIFIDGWAMVAPGNPALAAKLAEAAGSVSHDGESVHAAQLWAAMEAEAFVSKDVDHLLDTGLKFIPSDSLIAKLVKDVRGWANADNDWEKTRQRIEDTYGYDKFCGVCHVIPNHGIMISALIYAGHDFSSAMHIINTCGWDTDCNSGNVGCIVAIMNGLETFEGEFDWRGPLADRALISSADGGFGINNAVSIAYNVANFGHILAGEQPIVPPKNGAQFHFSLPGSTQGFVSSQPNLTKLEQVKEKPGDTGLSINLDGLTADMGPVEVMTQVFTPPDFVNMGRTYDLMATPLIYPGQTVTAIFRISSSDNRPLTATLRLKHYNVSDELSTLDAEGITIFFGRGQHTLSWKIPDTLDSQPIQAIGLAFSRPTATGTSNSKCTIIFDSLSYTGIPSTIMKRPSAVQANLLTKGEKCNFFRRAWIHNLTNKPSTFSKESFHLAHDFAEGLMYTGTRQWKDYKITIPSFKINLGSGGVLLRVQGLRRWYAVVLEEGRKSIAVLKRRDDELKVLEKRDWSWELDRVYKIEIVVKGEDIQGYVDGVKVIEAKDSEYDGGGAGFLVGEGSLAATEFEIGSVE